MKNTGFYFRAGVPDALIRAAQKMSAALKSGMEAEALRMTLELCTAETIARASSVYGLDPQLWSATAYGDDLTTFGTYPFTLPDLSGLFRMGMLGRFTPEELAQQKLLPMFFVTLPFLKRVEVCAVWARKHPRQRAILLTWLMSLWGYDTCSARKDLERNKILSLARYDSLRTILKFVRQVQKADQRRSRGDRPTEGDGRRWSTNPTADSESFVRDEFDQFVVAEEASRKYPDWLSVEEFCRNEDWAYAGLYDRLIPDCGPKHITKLMDELARKGSGQFAKMVRNGECEKIDFPIDQMFLYLVARSYKYDNLKNKALKCVKVLVKMHPEVLTARDKAGDGPLWQLLYSGERRTLCHLRAVARFLIHSGCDPDEKSSVGLSYNDVVKIAEALVGECVTVERGER